MLSTYDSHSLTELWSFRSLHIDLSFASAALIEITSFLHDFWRESTLSLSQSETSFLALASS